MRPQPTADAARAPRPLALLLAALASLVAVGCGAAPADPLAPPEIVYGEDVCDECRMIIDDERFAAAMIVSVDGEPQPRRFDDIGDMIAHAERQPELEVLRWYVHDLETLDWLDATTARYVRADPSRLPTPMGFGLAAFAEPARAEAFAAETQGEVLGFEELLAVTGDGEHDESQGGG